MNNRCHYEILSARKKRITPLFEKKVSSRRILKPKDLHISCKWHKSDTSIIDVKGTITNA